MTLLYLYYTILICVYYTAYIYYIFVVYILLYIQYYILYHILIFYIIYRIIYYIIYCIHIKNFLQYFFFIIQRVKGCAIPCPHLLPTRGDNTVSIAQGSTATPGTTKQLLPPDRVLKELYLYIIGASGVMVIIVGNRHGDTSSNPGRDWLHFT